MSRGRIIHAQNIAAFRKCGELKILQQEGLITDEYVQHQTEITEEIRAGINRMILGRLHGREEADWARFGKLRFSREARLKADTA